jgi:integrase
MSASKVAKRRRHVPVKGAQGVYWSETKHGKVYEVRHPANSQGRRLYEVVGTRLDQAKARAREVHGGAIAPVSVSMTLSEVVVDWQRSRAMRKRSAETFDAIYRVHIEPTLARRKVRDLDSRAIKAWLGGLKRQDGRPGELASGTRRLIYATLDIILRHAVEMNVLAAVPKLRRQDRPKASEGRKRILTPDEERTLLAYCHPFPWMRPIITLALHQALRLGEVCGLMWEDVDFAGGKLQVRRSLGRDGTLGPTKGGHEDEIKLAPAAREALLELRMDSDGTGLVFLNKLGGQRQLRDVQRAFDKARRRAGLEGVCFHSLRHTSISRLANAPGVPLVQVRDFARHTQLAVTMGYMHKIESEAVTTAMFEALAG